MQQFLKILEQAAADKLWGQIQFDFQAGQVVVIRRTETIKPIAQGTTADASSNHRA